MPNFMREGMKFAGLLPLAALLALLGACGQRDEVAEVAPLKYAGFLENRGADTGDLFGKVRFPSAYTQRSATVTIDDNGFITNPDGRFLIRGIPAGEHALVIHIKGFERIARVIWIDPHTINQVGSIPLQFARGAVLGRMVDENGRSATTVTVHLTPYGGFAVTDNEGIFQFIGVNSGSHLLTVEDSNFSLSAREVTLKSGEQRNLGIITLRRLSALSYSNVSPIRPME
ncbi:MAG: carboxypeptidase regulatory-like domain-containing protein [Candidatus Lambdaproteobacteria bacterium]|nr:carboxypeptidase regulatory-like domain-containing protein [Candidatus Lambdaproteobacteria bacterium]